MFASSLTSRVFVISKVSVMVESKFKSKVEITPNVKISKNFILPTFFYGSPSNFTAIYQALGGMSL